ncbi:aldo/keto reductase [Treponema sp.]
MKYRRLGEKIDKKVSALGFGCMRLPTIGGNASVIDEVEAEKMLKTAIDSGVNYIDTAYPYHGGKSEPFVGKTLSNGYRDTVFIATKFPVWLLEKEADFDRIFTEQLTRLQTDHIDFYLFHALSTDRWDKVKRNKGLEWAERMKKEGKIGHIGFSFHDVPEAFTTIMNEYDNWEFCQIQYNFMNENYQAGTAGLELASSRGIGVVVMEPLLGGGLAKPIPSVLKIWESAATKRSPVEWAFRWLWNKAEVGTVLSGMSLPGQVKENLRYAAEAAVGNLTQQELDLFPRVAEEYDRLKPIPCTSCEYCMPCPHGVKISDNFRIYNEAKLYDQLGSGKFRYGNLSSGSKASACVACGECIPKCPQHIAIIEELEKVTGFFEAYVVLRTM